MIVRERERGEKKVFIKIIIRCPVSFSVNIHKDLFTIPLTMTMRK